MILIDRLRDRPRHWHDLQRTADTFPLHNAADIRFDLVNQYFSELIPEVNMGRVIFHHTPTGQLEDKSLHISIDPNKSVNVSLSHPEREFSHTPITLRSPRTMTLYMQGGLSVSSEVKMIIKGKDQVLVLDRVSRVVELFSAKEHERYGHPEISLEYGKILDEAFLNRPVASDSV